MSDDLQKAQEEVIQPMRDKFLSALADESDLGTRRYVSICRRLDDLERKTKGSDDPEKMLVNFILLMLFLQVGLPLLASLVEKWVSRSSS